MTPQEQLRQMSEALQRAADNKARARQEAEKNAVFGQIGQYLGAALQPLHKAVEEMKRIGHSIGIMSSRLNNLEMQTPEVRVDLSTLHMPTPNITVKPIVDIPEIKIPGEMEVKGWINLMGYDRGLLTNPLPVQLRDAKGNPVKLFENLTQIVGGGGGWAGGGNHVIVDSMPSFSVSVAAATNTTVSLVNADGNYYNSANPLPVTMTASGSSSVSLVNADGSYYNSDNPLPVSFTAASTQQVTQVSGQLWSTESHTFALDSTGAWGGVSKGEGEAVGALRVITAGDAITSVNIVSSAIFAVENRNLALDHASTTFDYLKREAGESTSALRVVQATDSIGSVRIVSNAAALDVIQVSGSVSSTNLLQVGGNAVVVGTGYQDNALRVVNATDAITSVNLTQVLGSATVVGSGYQDNALRVVHATDAVASVSIVSNIAALDIKQVSGSIDSVSVIGVAMTTNPTAVSDAANVTIKTDKIGRQLARPVQVRGLLATAYTSLTTGTETTLATAAAGTYLDLVYVMGTNNSDAAVTVDLRAVSAGNIQTSIRIPANGTAGVSLPVPIPQDETGNAWTADMPDITGTTVTISALFSKEV